MSTPKIEPDEVILLDEDLHEVPSYGLWCPIAHNVTYDLALAGQGYKMYWYLYNANKIPSDGEDILVVSRSEDPRKLSHGELLFIRRTGQIISAEPYSLTVCEAIHE